MAKLTIHHPFGISSRKTIETIRLCLYEMNRVEKIGITMLSELISDETFRDLPKSAPQLHTLRIGLSSFKTGFSIHEDFLYDAERLQHVDLINCKISWDSRLLTGLTRLRLEVEDSSKLNSSMNQFLHALQRMPALTELRLKDSIPDDSEGHSTYPDIDLSCLRVLDISSGVGALTVVLHHIAIPHSAILKLTCKEKQSTQIDFSDFLSVLATKFLSSLVFRSLALQLLDCRLKFFLWTTETFTSFLIPLPQTQLELVLKWPSPQPHNYVKALTCAFEAMSLPFLTKLYISTFDYVDRAHFIDSQTWVKTFGTLPLLEWVHVHHEDCGIEWFLEALVYKTEPAEKSETAYYRNVSFPKLRHIYIETRHLYATSVDRLLDCLMERRERNAGVQGLCLHSWYSISPNDVERLKEIVVDVSVIKGPYTGNRLGAGSL